METKSEEKLRQSIRKQCLKLSENFQITDLDQYIHENGIIIVVCGGASLGSVHAGMLKKIAEENIKIHGIYGASIGTVVAGFLATNGLTIDSSKMLEDLFVGFRLTDLLDCENLDDETSLLSISNIKSFMLGIIKQKGLYSTEKAEEYMRNVLSNYDFEDPPFNWGFTITNLKNFESIKVSSEDIENIDDLVSYIMASCCFPIFTPKKIEDKHYIDGGFRDNLPRNFAAKKAKEISKEDPPLILALRLPAPGMIERYTQNVPCITLKPTKFGKDGVGNIFNFTEKKLNENISIGYSIMDIFFKEIKNT